MNNLKLSFICNMPKEHFPFWNDGLKAALEYLSKTYSWEINIYNIPSMVNTKIPNDADFYLFWGALDQPQHARRLFKKQGLCFGGGTTYHPNTENFDVVFAESKVDYEDFLKYPWKVYQAFGTNTQLFKPREVTKVWDYIYPAAFAKWKRHDKFVHFIKEQNQWDNPKVLAIGYKQPDNWEKECYEICEKNDIHVLPWIPTEAMAQIYNMAKCVVITADANGGCQRSILEAKASGVPVTIVSDSAKLLELEPLTYEDVLRNWSEISYGEKLKEGIEACLI